MGRTMSDIRPLFQTLQLLIFLLSGHFQVHIIGHIPPDGTLLWFQFNYYRIVERFHDTIAAQFFGHTHHDEFRLFYHSEDTETPNKYD